MVADKFNASLVKKQVVLFDSEGVYIAEYPEDEPPELLEGQTLEPHTSWRGLGYRADKIISEIVEHGFADGFASIYANLLLNNVLWDTITVGKEDGQGYVNLAHLRIYQDGRVCNIKTGKDYTHSGVSGYTIAVTVHKVKFQIAGDTLHGFFFNNTGDYNIQNFGFRGSAKVYAPLIYSLFEKNLIRRGVLNYYTLSDDVITLSPVKEG